jgi:non-specific serine/threonine protein kinase
MPPRTGPRTLDELNLVRETRAARSAQESNGSELWVQQRRIGLPAQPTSLIGREAELEALGEAILSGKRLLTLTGPGGVGKTRLAIELAGRVEHAFADGAHFVDFTRGNGPERVAASTARELGMQSTGNVSALDSLLRYLASRSLLLVFDGFEYAIAAAPELGEILAGCPGVTVIVTSLEPLHLRWERVQPIPPLNTPDPDSATLEDLAKNPCVQLFIQRAQAIRPEFSLTRSNARDIARICARLEGLPLAIELQAARANVLTAAAMAARLNERFSLLHRKTPDIPARHHSLQAALDWGYNLLDQEERMLLPRIAVYNGGFNLDMAIAAAGPEMAELDVLEQLASLVDKSFLIPSLDRGREPRFHFLDTVREYALERARLQGVLDAARERHLLYFLALAEQSEHGPGGMRQDEWLEHLDHEHDNLAEAFGCASHREDDVELRLAVALTPFWLARGHVREGTRRLTDALARHPGADVVRRVEALNGLANLLRWEGRFEPARAAIDEALQLAHPLGDPPLVDRLLLNLGILLTDQGEIEAARSVLRDLPARWEGRRDSLGVAQTIHYQGVVELISGAYEPAQSLLQQSLQTFEQLADSVRITAALIVLSRLASLKREPTRAHALSVEALRVSRDLGHQRLMCAAVEQAAGLLAAQAPPEAVAELLATSNTARHVGGLVRNALESSAYEDARSELVARAGIQSVDGWLNAGGGLILTRAADHALALLADAASPPARLPEPTSDTGKLSRREYEVLQFVAQGLSNKQIAHVLLISENTVKYHVTSLLNKLGADTRAQTVALAAQLNLLQHGHCE